ncbi:MAG TPA: hypothetical protein VGM58_11270 [Verrucomicrobiae bacterium]|jgi:hypothetical protein
MNKKFVFWMAFSLWVGVIGAVIGARMSNRMSSINTESANVTRVIFDVNTLNALQTNKTAKAIENLQNLLDLDLVALGHSISNAPSSEIVDPFIVKLVGDAKKYRERFPYTNCDTNMEQEISNLFLLVNLPTNK